jgi:hypothetical protein
MSQTELTLNPNEQTVLQTIAEADAGLITLQALAKKAFKGGASKTKGNSKARNALRKIRKAGLIDQPTPGVYRLTAAGKSVVKALNRAAA